MRKRPSYRKRRSAVARAEFSKRGGGRWPISGAIFSAFVGAGVGAWYALQQGDLVSLAGVAVTFGGALAAIALWYGGLYFASWLAAPEEMDAELGAGLLATQQERDELRTRSEHALARSDAKRRVLELLEQHQRLHGRLTNKDIHGPDGERKWSHLMSEWQRELRDALEWHPPTAEAVFASTPTMSGVELAALSGGWRWMTPLSKHNSHIADRARDAMERDPWF